MGLFDFIKNKNEVKEEDADEQGIIVEDAKECIILESEDANKVVEKIPNTEQILYNAKKQDEFEEIIVEDNSEEIIIDINEENAGTEGEKVSFFKKMFSGLAKTRENIADSVENIFKAFTKIDEEFFEELEDALILADLGAVTASNIMELVRERVLKDKIKETALVKDILIEEIVGILERDNRPLELPSPTVILVIGVNGVGKTTTIGKLASKYKGNGKSVLLAAGDTFRAAAIEQLTMWGMRSNINVIKHEANSDPGAVIFDAVKSAKAKGTDILICDTAGRLHNKKNLMDELKKMHKIINREYSEANVEVFLVLDGTTGQNALSQAKLFNEVAEISGIVLTKLDGTAKGGIVISIKNELNIPVRYVGFGEKVEDLGEFSAKDFAKALFDVEE